MADKLTVLNHLRLLALRCSATITQKVSELAAITAEAIAEIDETKADTSALNSHTNNTTAHITAAERSAWNAKASTSEVTTIANNAAAGALSEAKTYTNSAVANHSHTPADIGAAPAFTYGTDNIEAGSASPYETGHLHLVIE